MLCRNFCANIATGVFVNAVLVIRVFVREISLFKKMDQIIAGLDIGTSKIRTVIGVLNKDSKTLQIVGVGVSPSLGLRKGSVVDVNEVIANISASLEDTERMSGVPVHHVFVSIGGTHTDSVN